MRAIWKYTFDIQDRMRIRMPSFAKILKIEMQGTTPCLWALVNTDGSECLREFVIVGTGHEHDDEWWEALEFVDTFQEPPFVWHMFEVRT